MQGLYFKLPRLPFTGWITQTDAHFCQNLIFHGKHWYSHYRNYYQCFSKFILDYVDSLYKTLEQALIEGNLVTSRNEVKEMTPPPISASFEKQNKEEAVKKHETRKTMVTKEVLPTPLPGRSISNCPISVVFLVFGKNKVWKSDIFVSLFSHSPT